MSEMVERVRNALVTADTGNHSGCPDYQALALAAIEAMREPTEAMLQAMKPWTNVSGHQDLVWKTGIDEALK